MEVVVVRLYVRELCLVFFLPVVKLSLFLWACISIVYRLVFVVCANYVLILVIVCVLDHINFEKIRQGRYDYDFHCFGEVCNFVYCPLLKTQEINELPSIHQWEDYMSVETVTRFSSIALDSFLVNYDLGEDLPAGKSSEFRDFRVKCKEFIDQLSVTILKHGSVTPGVSHGLSSF